MKTDVSWGSLIGDVPDDGDSSMLKISLIGPTILGISDEGPVPTVSKPTFDKDGKFIL